MKAFFLFLTILLLFSCEKKQNIENEILNCLASKIDEGTEIASADFFASLKQMEIICQDEGYLKNLYKSGYISFLDTIFSNDKLASLFDKLNKQVPQYGNVGTSLILGHYHVCIFNLMVTTDFKSDYLDKKMYQFEQLEMNGFSDYETLASYMNGVNFENEKDRLFLFSIFYVYLYYK
jgi:hypothetical protein